MNTPNATGVPSRASYTPWIIFSVLGCLVLCLVLATVVGGVYYFLMGPGKATSVSQTVAPKETTLVKVQPTSTPRITKTPSQSLDLSTLDVCAFIPLADVESVWGSIKRTSYLLISDHGEKGCVYYNMDGNWVNIIFHQESQYNVAWKRENESSVSSRLKEVSGIGDSAFYMQGFRPVQLWVLVKGKAAIQINADTYNEGLTILLAQKVVALLR